MNFLKTFLNFYINSSIHVALAIVAFTAITVHHFELEPNSNLYFFIFFASASGYNFVKYSEIAGFRHFSLNPNLRLIQIFSFISFWGMIYFAFQISVEVLMIALFLALLNFLYALPFINRSSLRSVAGLKIFIIAFVWAVATVILPLMDARFFELDAIVEFIQRFLFVLVLMLPFEIRDLRFDQPEIVTIPHIIGIKNTRFAGLALLFLIITLELLQSSESHVFILLLISSITLIFLMRAKGDQNKYFSSFWIEGIPIFWWILIATNNFWK